LVVFLFSGYLAEPSAIIFWPTFFFFSTKRDLGCDFVVSFPSLSPCVFCFNFFSGAPRLDRLAPLLRLLWRLRFRRGLGPKAFPDFVGFRADRESRAARAESPPRLTGDVLASFTLSDSTSRKMVLKMFPVYKDYF